MKFNLEKAKEDAKKVAIGAGIVVTSSGAIEAQEQNIEKIDNSKKIEINVEQNKQVDGKTISFEDAEKIVNKGGNYNENIKPITLMKDKEISEENILLLKQLSKLEGNFHELSNEEYKIIDGSISIISGVNLAKRSDPTKYEYKDGIERTSSLENRVIINILESYIINNIETVKVLGKDQLTLDGVRETKKISDDGYIKLKENGYKHSIPEYYFVLDQKNNDSKITFNIKIVSSRERNVIKNISFTENLPEGNQVLDIKFEKLVKEKIIPDLIQKVNEIFIDLKLIKNE